MTEGTRVRSLFSQTVRFLLMTHRIMRTPYKHIIKKGNN
nr:MAG TPA: hypothetical protein [Caudoviricetes sp.]